MKAGEEKTNLKRLRLILVAAAGLPGARPFIPSLQRKIKDSYDQRHRVTLPYQCTDELLLWAYALDGKQHAMFWLSPENHCKNPFLMANFPPRKNGNSKRSLLIERMPNCCGNSRLALKTKPAHKWQLILLKYTCSPRCCSQTWPAQRHMDNVKTRISAKADRKELKQSAERR